MQTNVHELNQMSTMTSYVHVLCFCFLVYIITNVHTTSQSRITSSSLQLRFLNNLNGTKRSGECAAGLHKLKKHLLHLRYYNRHHYNDDNGNLFDHSLELALKRYQDYHNLYVSGVLDPNTIIELLQNDHRYYSFFSGQPKWKKRRLSYTIHRSIYDKRRLAIERAIRQWSSSTHFMFDRLYHMGQADIKISFMRGYHGDGYPFVGAKDSGLAHTFAPPDGRIHFDAAQRWSTDGQRDAYDVETVDLHEMGHALGLEHSRVKEAVMYAVIYPGQRKTLIKDDIEGIKVLYKPHRGWKLHVP